VLLAPPSLRFRLHAVSTRQVGAETAADDSSPGGRRVHGCWPDDQFAFQNNFPPHKVKRLQAGTAVNNPGQAAAKLDALLPAILDRAFKGELSIFLEH
jgi:hypothetical protein